MHNLYLKKQIYKDGKYLAKVNYGYNGIVTNRIYYVQINSNLVDFYTDNTYTKQIPQSLPIEDIDIINNPTTKDIEEANKNGENARIIYRME